MHLMKKISLACLLGTSVFAINQSAWAQQSALPKVAITAIVEHPALESIRKGIIDELAHDGYVDGKNIDIIFENAQGSAATAAQIARNFVGVDPAVIVPITTPSAQPVAAATRNIPIIFSAITNPISAKLVKHWGKNKGNIAGVSDLAPMEPQIELIKKLVPNVKTIGYIYSPGESNSVATLKQLEAAAQKAGLKVLASPAQRTIDISTAAGSLVGKVQVIYTSTDNNVVSAYESLYKVAEAAQIPLIAADGDTVKRGAIAALATNQYDIGRKTGDMVALVLEGTPVSDIPTVKMDKLNLVLNVASAKRLGVKIPESVLKEASTIYNQTK